MTKLEHLPSHGNAMRKMVIVPLHGMENGACRSRGFSCSSRCSGGCRLLHPWLARPCPKLLHLILADVAELMHQKLAPSWFCCTCSGRNHIRSPDKSCRCRRRSSAGINRLPASGDLCSTCTRAYLAQSPIIFPPVAKVVLTPFPPRPDRYLPRGYGFGFFISFKGLGNVEGLDDLAALYLIGRTGGFSKF